MSPPIVTSLQILFRRSLFPSSSSSCSTNSFRVSRVLLAWKKRQFHHQQHPQLLSRIPSLSSSRSFTTSQGDKKDDEKKGKATTTNFDTKSFMDTSFRGVGQVLFLNSKTSGLTILGGLVIGDPYLAFLATTGTLTATAMAQTSQLDKSALHDGLWSYNGCLIGCATAVFLHPMVSSLSSPSTFSTAEFVTTFMTGTTATMIGAGITPFVAAALKPACGSVPQFTLAFNMVALSTLLQTRPLLETSAAAGTATTFWDTCLEAPLHGISQIFVVESMATGAIILGGIAMYSRGLALHTLVGSSAGAITGALLFGADLQSIGMGLWGYNSALTSLGVGVFFVHSPHTMALSVGGAAVTAGIFGAMSSVFGAYGSPCLTLPFCLAMSGCYLLRDAIPGLVLAKSPHSPEKNKNI